MINFKEKYKIVLLSAVGMIIFLAVFGFVKDTLSGEEGRIKKFILHSKKVIESRNTLACGNIISGDYSDKHGNTRESLLYTAREMFRYYDDMFVSIEKVDITLDDAKQKADVELTALVVSQTKDKEERILEGEKGKFRIRLIKEEDKWRLLELEFFQPIRAMGHNIS